MIDMVNEYRAKKVMQLCKEAQKLCAKISFDPTQPSELARSDAGRSSAIYRDMWAVVFPDGHIVTGSDLQTEADAWRIALGWPGPEEIDAALKRGVFAVKSRLRYYSSEPEHHE